MEFKSASILMGSLFFIIGAIAFFKRRYFVKNSIILKGVVIEIRKDNSSDITSYFPVIKYYDEVERREHIFKSETGYNRSKYKVGDEVEIRYLIQHGKSKECLNTWFAIWGFSFLFMTIGALFGLIGI